MLTGLVPAVHGVVRNGEKLDSSACDLADIFGAAGYESAAFLNAKFLRSIAGSFAHVEARGLKRGNAYSSGADVVDATIAWLDGPRKGERFFLWVHLYDPHTWQNVVREHARDAAPIWTGKTPADFLARLAELQGLPAPEEGKPYRALWGSQAAGDVEGFWRPEPSRAASTPTTIGSCSPTGSSARLHEHVEGPPRRFHRCGS
jgi:hypothetical protein